MTSREWIFYSLAQVTGALLGVLLTHAMFGLELFQLSEKKRGGSPALLSEGIATLGLLATIQFGRRSGSEWLPARIAAYVISAYWFTSSTTFANPAVTVARMVTSTFCGIAPSGVLPFCGAQFAVGLAFSLGTKRFSQTQ